MSSIQPCIKFTLEKLLNQTDLVIYHISTNIFFLIPNNSKCLGFYYMRTKTQQHDDSFFEQFHSDADLGCLWLHISPSHPFPPLSLSSHVPSPVIACQINVPLCNQAQKLSCHIQLLLPWYFSRFFSFSSLCSSWLYIYHFFPSCFLSLLLSPHLSPAFLDSGFLFLCCLSSSVCSVPSLGGPQPHPPPIFFSHSVSLCVFVLPCANVPP